MPDEIQRLIEPLQLMGAHMFHYNKHEIQITTNKQLPQDMIALASSFNMEAPLNNVQSMSGQIFDTGYTRITYHYSFPKEQAVALYALALVHTENERYKEFCEALDKEVIQELGTSETEV